MSLLKVNGRALQHMRSVGSTISEVGRSKLNESPVFASEQLGSAGAREPLGLAGSLVSSHHQLRGRRPDFRGALACRQFGTERFCQSHTELSRCPEWTSDPKKGHGLVDRAVLDNIKRDGKISKLSLSIVDQPRFQSPGQCHINALQNVYLHASGEVISQSLGFIEGLAQRGQLQGGFQGAALGKMAELLQLLMHFKVSITGRPPQGFENAECGRKIDTPEAMAALLDSRLAFVVQGAGRAVTALDSDLRKPIVPQYAIEVSQPVIRESDGSVNSNHSILVLAVSTRSNPVPELLPNQCLIFDQDPNRDCIRQALDRYGWSQTPPHELTSDQIKEAGVDYLMTRVVSFDDLSQTRGTGGVGFLPIGGLVGGRFFVPSMAS